MTKWKTYEDNINVYIIAVVDWQTFKTDYITAVGDKALNERLNALCEIKNKKIDFKVFKRVNIDCE